LGREGEVVYYPGCKTSGVREEGLQEVSVREKILTAKKKKDHHKEKRGSTARKKGWLIGRGETISAGGWGRGEEVRYEKEEKRPTPLSWGFL